MTSDQRVALVTGANRGIGFETSRQLAQQGIQVILGSRSPEKGETAASKLRQEGLKVVAHQLSVTDEDGIQSLAQLVENQFGRLDILVNNAGIMPDTGSGILNNAIKPVREALETNTFGPLLLTQAFMPLMKKHGYGRIVNVSSGMGQLEEMGGGYAAYRISKTALNAVTRIFASELAGTNIKVNSVCPGWVQTDMGGAGAPRTLQQGADTIVWLATLPDGGPSGGFWRDRTPIPW